MLAQPLNLRCPQSPVPLESNLLLAPIAGWCELAWRVTCRQLGGVGLACTDLLSPQGLLISKETSRDLAQTNSFDQPIGMQLYGADPEILARGALWCAQHGATVVDINMGCPVDKVTKKDGGSKLMCDVHSTTRMFERVRAELPADVPLTAKMRLGWSQDDADAGVGAELAVALCERGAAMITVHGRTTEQRFKGVCSHEGIARVVDAVAHATGEYDGTIHGGVPVIGNGDIKHPADIITMMHNTRCAGVMIGRGSFSNPWLFRLGWALQERVLERGVDPGDRAGVERIGLGDIEPNEHERLDMLLGFFDRIVEYRDGDHALHVMRQKANLLGRPINGGHCRPLKNALREARCVEDVRDAIARWRDEHADDDADTRSRVSR